MCELMGMSFAKPAAASVSIQAFSLRAEGNADGWGLAWYPDRSLAMVKQPVRWSIQHTEFLEHYPGLLSSTYVAHVRQRTSGSNPTHADTHPFARELNGREYCFAHNGTLKDAFWDRPLGRFQPLGTTDSEYLFCLLLAELEDFARLASDVKDVRGDERAEEKADPAQSWKWLHPLLLRLNDYGRLNCILTDGEHMMVYHDRNGWKNLTYRHVFLHEDTPQHFGDATLAVNLQAAPVNHGVIVATNPLSMEGWERFLPGELKILHKGNVVFTARPTMNGKAKSTDTTHLTPAANDSNGALTTEKMAKVG